MTLINDATMMAVQQGLDLRHHRERLLASNIANIDTPQYTPVDLEFEGALQSIETQRSGSLSMARSERTHMVADGPSFAARGTVLERGDRGNSLDLNELDLDREMARFADNAVKFSTTAEIARRRIAMVRYAISAMGV